MFEDRASAIAAGFDPHTLTEQAARRRQGDAAAGRDVEVPLAWQVMTPATASSPERASERSSERAAARAAGRASPVQGLTVRCGPAGRIRPTSVGHPPELGTFEGFWRRVATALDALPPRPGSTSRLPEAVDGWGVLVLRGADPRMGSPRRGGGDAIRLMARSADWELVDACLAAAPAGRRRPSDAATAAPRVLAQHLARIDGDDDWGCLYLEVRSRRHEGRLAEARSLRWRAAYGAHYLLGEGDASTLAALGQHRFELRGPEHRVFVVRGVAEWDRPDALQSLRLPTAGAHVWPWSSLPDVLDLFADGAPVPDDSGPQDELP